MSTKTKNSATARKVVGSLGVIGAAAAVAGMGTFGTFTDTSTPVKADVDTGVLSVSLGAAATYATVPLVPGGLVPGDTKATPFDLKNDGTLAWSSVNFASAASRSTIGFGVPAGTISPFQPPMS